jgi:hypothetical protein
MVELRRTLSSSALPIQPSIRRSSIALSPWDVIGFKFADPKRPFNKYPHLTVGIHDRKVDFAVTLPDQDVFGCWDRLRRASREQLKAVLEGVARRLHPVRRHVTRDTWEPQMQFSLFQRHFYAQRYGTVDGEIKFDLDALFRDRRRRLGRARVVPAWLDAIHMVLAQTARANFELQLRAEYPLRDGSVTRKPEFVGALVRTAEAFQPFIAFLTGPRIHQEGG